jgi:hypothetical protein
MKAMELVGTIDHNGQVNLDQPLIFPQGSRVKVIVLWPELNDSVDEQEKLYPIQLQQVDLVKKSVEIEKSLSLMVNDPEIQREIKLINAEFTITELDGIETL